MRTLYSKLALTLCGLLVTVGLLYLLLSQSLIQRHMYETEQRFNRDLARTLVEDRGLVSRGSLDKQALKETFDLYMTINPSIEIYLLDLHGNILAYSAEPGAVKRKQVSLRPIRAFLDGAALPLLGDDPRSHDRRKSFSVTPVPSAQAPQGYLYVVLRGEKYTAIEDLYQESLLFKLSAWILAGSLLFGLVTGLLIFYALTRRLRRLNRLLNRFRDSDFQEHIGYGARREGDEVDQLGAGFDAMAARMQAMLTALQETDALRRELVNNVSHDLRTPLTCLHGYLETLQHKGAQLDPQQREQYLRYALGHSERLGKLISELFELAKLDAQVVKPQCEPFAPAELLSDIVGKFQLLAQQKGVYLTFDVAAGGAYVDADIGLIERVLENLVGNALQHTDEDGQIELGLTTVGGRLAISVRDTGRGIAAEDLPRVFERYYRGKQTRGNGHGIDNTGLGLAIAKRIVELHGSELSVSSQPDSGTCFNFSLPIWRAAQT